MKRIFPILTAAVMAVCTLSVLPQTAASAITNDDSGAAADDAGDLY
ncbi:MAG: hypothetical protein ACLTXT_02930 [Ruminococcus callidus]